MKVLIAMSGGVDSSVAAKLLCDGRCECVGCMMKLFDADDLREGREKTCCSANDAEDARAVAFRLGIPFHVFNFCDDFREKIINKFVCAYLDGKTPNPCVDCNRYMKFEKLFERARILGCDHIATGHYARVSFENGKYLLKKALDESKDQSYVLWSLTQEQLAHVLFPLGELSKSETRRIAEEAGFLNARKKDSQDICFVPDGDYASLIAKVAGSVPGEGDYLDEDGGVIGRHKGIIRYTIGQHKGLGMPFPDRMYVLSIDKERNAVVLGPSESLFRKEVLTERFHWISGEAPAGPIRCKAKIRYRQKEQWATAEPQEDGAVRIVFDEAQRAVTPGQSAVLYDGDVVLGGGEIAAYHTERRPI